MNYFVTACGLGEGQGVRKRIHWGDLGSEQCELTGKAFAGFLQPPVAVKRQAPTAPA